MDENKVVSLADRLGIVPGEEAINLPSKGANGNPAQVIVRPFTAKDEKYMAAVNLNNPMPGLVRLINAITLTQEFDAEKAYSADGVAVLLAARALTYGNDIHTTCVCDACGESEKCTVDVGSLDVVPETWTNHFKFTFEKAGFNITYKHLTIGEELAAIKTFEEGSKLMDMNPEDKQNKIHIQKAAKMITGLYKEGKEIEASEFEIAELLENTITKGDTDDWVKDIDKTSLDHKFEFEFECGKCKDKKKYRLDVDFSFFFQRILDLPKSCI